MGFWGQRNNKIFKGSGYDIACANSISPIVYQLNNGQRIIEEVSFKPSFHEKIYFIYLNKKQSSISEIENYNNKKISESTINEISNITSMILQCSSMESFEKLPKSNRKLFCSSGTCETNLNTGNIRICHIVLRFLNLLSHASLQYFCENKKKYIEFI